MCGSSIASLDAVSAKTNGVIQIFTSIIFIILAILNWGVLCIDPAFASLSGLAAISLFLGGVMILRAGIRRSAAAGLIVAALIFAVVNILTSLYILYITLVDLNDFASYPSPRPPHASNTAVLFFFTFTTFAAYAMSFAVIWAVVIASRALHYRADAGAEVHRNLHARSKCSRANWIAQAVVTAVKVVFVTVISARSDDLWTSEGASPILACMLACFPVYLLNVYLGFRSWRLGENSSLISFLVVNIIQLPLILWQSVTWGNWRYSGYFPLQTFFKSVLIVSGVAHFCFSIWGIVTSSVAIHHDGSCSNVGADDRNAGRNAVQPHVAMMVVPPGTNGTGSRMILVPVNGQQMPMNAGLMPMNAGLMPMNAGQMPIHNGQMTLQTGQLQAGLYNISNVTHLPSYAEQIANQPGQIQTGIQNIDSPPPSYENSRVMNHEQIANQTGEAQTGIQNFESPPPSYDNHAFSVIIE